jgi:diguanylate cyclase (GGDEF)-like protein
MRVTAAIALALLAAVAAALAVVAWRRRRRLDALEDAILALARSWSEDGTSRGLLCTAARQVAGAQVAYIAEPTRRGDELVISAVASRPALAGHTVPVDGEESLTAQVYLTGQAVHVTDVDGDPAVRPMLRDIAGARSAHLRPIRRGEHVVGVLVLGWSARHAELAEDRRQIVAMLAEQAARAIGRDAHYAILQRQARTDELTALPNRRAWDEAMQREMARSQRSGEPLCVALLDLDHFKAYNDTYGHQAGDAHLRRTAAAWRRELRATDILARYGGEEFGVLLPDTDVEQAQEVLDRVRESTPNAQTASAGVVLYDQREPVESLVARADAALYRAKHAGRGQTVLA